MTMEAHKLRFVRCPRCLQLLVEYPTIPVYQCGSCGTVLRAKNRVVPVAEAGSESDEHNNVPSSLNGYPQNSKTIFSDNQKIVSSSDKASEDVVDRSISSTIKNTNSGDSAIHERTSTPTEHQNEETCSSSFNGNTQDPGVIVRGINEKGTAGDSSSTLMEKLDNIDTGEYENQGKVDNIDTSEVCTLNENTEMLEVNKGTQKYEDTHAESHEALIEELERSLSFSSDDEYFSDEAENNGLSDALRNQMGSRRYMLGGKTNDASQSDPHSRLIEELEMSFSDAEDPTEHIAKIAEKVHADAHDINPQTLGTESAHLCEESISSCSNGHLRPEQTFHEENKLIYSNNQGKEYIDGSQHVYENAHIVVSDEDIAEGLQEKEQGKDWQAVHVESADPCEGSVNVSSVADSSITDQQLSQPNDLISDGNDEEGCVESDDMTNCVQANESLVSSNEDIAERIHWNEELAAEGNTDNEQNHMEADDTANCVNENQNIPVAEEDITEKADGNEHSKDQQSLDAVKTNIFKGTILSFNAGHIKSEQSFQNNDITSDATGEKEEDRIEDINTANCIQEDGTEECNMINSFQVDGIAIASFSSLQNKSIQSKLPSFKKNKEEIPCRYQTRQLHQGLSLDSEDFKSIQNFVESQMDGTSSCLSSGALSQADLVHGTSNKFNNIFRHERLRKMDELRDQLSRLSSQKSLEKGYQKRGLEYQQAPSGYDVEQYLQSVDADSIPSSCALELYYGHGRPLRYQPLNSLSPSHSYTRYRFGPTQTHIPHSYDALEFDSYYQSSYTDSTILDHELLKPSYKEQKRLVRKHILRPLSGASPFTVCNSCFNLVQTPSDVYISKAKIGKMQCGQCSKVLVLSFTAAYHAEANIGKDVAQLSKKPDGTVVTKNKDATSHSAECSVNEEHGASFTRSLSTRAESSLVATQSGKKDSDSALHRLMGYDSASQLLRHSRVFEDGCESFESMVPVSSRVFRRKNM
ncbi:hypothetical protein ACP4OV_014884 [Aristida adscensionis]